MTRVTQTRTCSPLRKKRSAGLGRGFRSSSSDPLRVLHDDTYLTWFFSESHGRGVRVPRLSTPAGAERGPHFVRIGRSWFTTRVSSFSCRGFARSGIGY